MAAALERKDRTSSAMEAEDCEPAVAARDSTEEEDQKDPLAWAHHILEAQYLDLACFSPKGLNFTPRGVDGGGVPDFGALCASPLFSDQLKFLQSWSPKALAGQGSGVASFLTNSESVPASSTSVSCESSEPATSEPMVGSESTGSGDEARGSPSRKRKASVERDPEQGSNVTEGDEGELPKRRNSNPTSVKQQKMKGPKRLREPRYAIKTRTEVDIMEDGYKWRKYGQKPVKNSPHPRNYYRCTTANCPVRKRVERSQEDPGLVVTSYEGTHIHPKINHPKSHSTPGNYPTYEAESLQESLSQLQNQAATNALPPHLAKSMNPLGGLPSLNHFLPSWPSLMNRPVPQPPSMQDNMSFIMAYQLVRLQWELQAKAQQFINYNAAQEGLMNPGVQMPKNLFAGMDSAALGFGGLPGAAAALPDLASLMQSYAERGDSGTLFEQMAGPQFPKPEATSNLMTSSLLSRRANARQQIRTGSSLNPNLQSGVKMQQQSLAQQMQAGIQNPGFEQDADQAPASSS